MRHGYVYEMRRATYGWFNRWLEMKDRDDTESRSPWSLKRRCTRHRPGSSSIRSAGNSAHADAADGRGAAHAGIRRRRRRRTPSEPCSASRTSLRPLNDRVLATIRKPGYRAEQFEFTSEQEIRIPGWLLTPEDAGSTTPTVLYVGEGAAWNSTAEDAFAERLCAAGRCRVAVIDVRGRGDCAMAYPPRGRAYFFERVTDEAYLTWFTLMLGKPLLGGQVHDALRAMDYVRSRVGRAHFGRR